MFKVNPSAYGGVFVLPADIVDRYLKLAPAGFIEVLLYLFRHCDTPLSSQAVADATGFTVSRVSDALLYWEQENLILPSDKAPILTPSATKEESPKTVTPTMTTSAAAEPTPDIPPKKDFSPVKHQLPSYGEVCSRMKESAEVREFLGCAQSWLGRTVGNNDLAHLLDLYDYYGLPFEVIMTIGEYARTNGKGSNMHYIYTVGQDWSRRGIDTMEAADDEFKKIENLNTVWSQFCKAAGIHREHPTPAEKDYIDIWTGEWHFSVPMLLLAYEEMNRYTDRATFKYMHKILLNWHENNITTPEHAKVFQEEYRKKQDEALAKKAKRNGISENAAKQAPVTAPSYDIDRATQMANTAVPELKKKR